MLLQVPSCVVPGQDAADATEASITKADPASADSINAELNNAEPASADPTSAELTGAELSSAEPGNVVPTKVEPGKAEPSKVDQTTRACTCTEPSAKASSVHAEKDDGFHEIEDGCYCEDATKVYEERQKAREAPGIVQAICEVMEWAVLSRERETKNLSRLDKELHMCRSVAAFLSKDYIKLPWQLRWKLFLDQRGLTILTDLL